MTKAKVTKDERAAMLVKLREWYPKGSTVYTILRSASRSGMSRQISPVAVLVGENGKPDTRHPSYTVSIVLGYALKRDWPSDSLTVKGCGMDMGYEIAYNLGRVLWEDGYALKHAWL